jgi:hypothetical protein
MGQGHQPVRQELQGPAFAAFWRLALGQGRQDRFHFVIDFGEASRPRSFIQGKNKSFGHEPAPGADDRGPTRM